MLQTVSEIRYLDDVALVTVNRIPNSPQCLAAVMRMILHQHTATDVICYAPPCRNKASCSFTLPQAFLPEMIRATPTLKSISPDIFIDVNGNNTKFTFFSLDSLNDADLFQRLADANISVKWIATTETRFSCLVDCNDAEKMKTLFTCKKHFI